jgi:hypothetical protein
MLHSSAIGRGELGAAASAIEAAVRAGSSGQLPELLLLAAIFDSTSRLLGGDLDGAREGYEEIARAVGSAGDPNAENIWLWARFAVDFAAGDTSALVETAERVMAKMPWHSTDLLLVALLDAGRVEEARARFDPTPLQRDVTWLYNVAVRAHLACELGDVETARATYEELLPWSGTLVRPMNGTLSLGPADHYLARLAALLSDDAAARGHLERSHRLAEAAAPTWAPGWARDVRL